MNSHVFSGEAIPYGSYTCTVTKLPVIKLQDKTFLRIQIANKQTPSVKVKFRFHLIVHTNMFCHQTSEI